MKELPILFSTPMVQAILEGKKMQTRRIVAIDDLKQNPSWFRFIGDHIGRDFPRPAIKYDDRIWYEWQLTNSNGSSWIDRCKWKKNDLLWVRENFRVNSWMHEDGEVNFRYEADGAISPFIGFDDEETFNRYWIQSCDDLLKAGYEANEEERFEGYDYKALRLRPNIFLPKEAARIWLQVENIKVERLQDISEEDAINEGVGIADTHFKYSNPLLPDTYFTEARNAFFSLWESINGKESLDANPWLWALDYKVLSTTGKPDLKNIKA